MVMLKKDFRPISMDHLGRVADESQLDWLWEGYLARGSLTLLTSQWKAGKTTLVTGLLRALASGGEFLGLPCKPATALVISEESQVVWMERQKEIPLGPHVQLLSRPFPMRPSPTDWQALVDHVFGLRAEGQLDLLVVDTLTAFLPGKSDSDPATLLELLHPLRHLAECGVANLILHHPRRKPSEEGCAARGSGALLGFVNVILELSHLEGLASDQCRRKLIGLSHHRATPRHRVYEWAPGTSEFTHLSDVFSSRYQDNWETVKSILTGRTKAATHAELLDDWPPELPPPVRNTLYHWLSRATKEGLVKRSGYGTKKDPYRFRLPNEMDEFELPPLDMSRFW